MKLKYYKNLDGIRAFAAIIVMFFHFFQSVQIDSNSLVNVLKKISLFGQTGVDLFFVLSGFLITRILINSKSNPHFFKNFIFRRIVRIFPLYYLFLFLYFFIAPILLNTQFIPLNEQWFYYVYLQNIGATFNWNLNGPEHFWSLAIEEHFYLFWPFLIYFFNQKSIKYLIAIIVVGTIFLRYLMIRNNLSVFYFTFTRIDALAIGAGLSLLELNFVFQKKNKNKFLILLLILVVPMVVFWIKLSGSGSLEVIKYSLLAFFYFALIGYVLCLSPNNFVNTILESKLLNFSGKISYGLYVYHPLVFLLVFKYYDFLNWKLQLMLSFTITYLVAIFSYYLFENQFLKLKKYF
jgi:peptidoglycan/LPS O-acetylase OafA/YrhL